MDPLTIRVRPDGPLVLQGPVAIVDEHGNAFVPPSGKPLIALCRCGQSATKPFCDGAHKRSGFHAAELAPLPPAQS